jgi:magnesium chelatase subunit H
MIRITFLYVGSSLPWPVRQAERDVRERWKMDLQVSLHNCGAPLSEAERGQIELDLSQSDIVFIIHVTDQENASFLREALSRHAGRHRAVVAINCLPDLMRETKMGKLEFAALMRSSGGGSLRNLVRKLGNWLADSMRSRSPAPYSKLAHRLPAILKLVPAAGRARDLKNYLQIFCYFLQPTPENLASMMLYAIKCYVPGCRHIEVPLPETMPALAIYHPDAPQLFESFEDYRRWYELRGRALSSDKTIGLLLLRPQVISRARRHYDFLIRAIEDEGLGVIPVTTTFLDNRDACRAFFMEADSRPRISQIVSLTGFSFVGGPVKNDSRAAAEFLKRLDVPLRSIVSLDVQTIEDWQSSRMGLNPIQTVMQVAIPEIDGATEPFIYGGMRRSGNQPEPIEDRSRKIARRLARWNHLRTAPRSELRLAFVIFCFPPDKGNVGTAAELDVFASLLEILKRLKSEGYSVSPPENPDQLRELILGSSEGESIARAAYSMSADQYCALCPYADEIERQWGPIGREITIMGAHFGNAFIGVQPGFGYEGDPVRMLASEGGTPTHDFMALYTYIEKVFRADAVIHVGTHGALEFMPGKQVGLSANCWPDRLIGDLPHIYIYSVNNPSEGAIARRRSYAELISYLTPPLESAGLYRELAQLKELIAAYRQSNDETEREQLFKEIQEKAEQISL